MLRTGPTQENIHPRVLMLRIEPASYMIALIKALRSTWPGEIDVVFASAGLSQKWDLERTCLKQELLPEGWMKAMYAVRRRIHETRPDLLHIAGWSAPSSLAAILVAGDLGLPVVVDLDTWRGTPSWWRGLVKRRLYPLLFRLVDHFAPGGKKQAAYLRGFDVPKEKITAVGMTVDVLGIRRFLADEPGAGESFRRRFNIAIDAPMVLFIGRLVSLKGFDDLVTAWPEVAAQVPGARLVVAGDGELRERIAAAAKTDASICPVGRLSGEDVWRAYAAADFVAAPSHFENWGLVVNEAMAAGKPVVVTDVFGCVGDLARHEETALVIPVGAPQHLANSMIRLATDPNMRNRLASNASKVISGWTIENEAKMISGIWQRALSTSSRDCYSHSDSDSS